MNIPQNIPKTLEKCSAIFLSNIPKTLEKCSAIFLAIDHQIFSNFGSPKTLDFQQPAS